MFTFLWYPKILPPIIATYLESRIRKHNYWTIYAPSNKFPGQELHFHWAEKSQWTENERSMWQLSFVDFDRSQLFLGDFGVSNRSHWNVQNLVAILFNFLIQTRNRVLVPLFAEQRQKVSQKVRFGNSTINVWNDYLVSALPEKYVRGQHTGSLIGSRNFEIDFIGSFTQIQALLEKSELQNSLWWIWF